MDNNKEEPKKITRHKFEFEVKNGNGRLIWITAFEETQEKAYIKARKKITISWCEFTGQVKCIPISIDGFDNWTKKQWRQKESEVRVKKVDKIYTDENYTLDTNVHDLIGYIPYKIYSILEQHQEEEHFTLRDCLEIEESRMLCFNGVGKKTYSEFKNLMDYVKNKELSKLKEGDYIAFGFNFNGGSPDEIIVSNITSKHGNEFLVHFMYGHHSLGEYIKENEVLAIGNRENGKTKIKGWSGMFDCLLPDNHLMIKNKHEISIEKLNY